MIGEYKTIINDLLKYTIDGVHDGTTAIGFNGISYDSTEINNIKYQFIRKYEHCESITDPSIVPVLVVTQPEQYLQGKILYKNKFKDLRTLVVRDEDSNNNTIGKINFFIIPQIVGIQGHNLGSINYDLKIDYITDYDTYGFMSKEIDNIMKRHYFRNRIGNYHTIPSPHGNMSSLFFVPTTQRSIAEQSVLSRLAQSFDVKFCTLV